MLGHQVAPDSTRADTTVANMQEASDTLAEGLQLHERISEASELAFEGQVLASLEALVNNLPNLLAQKIPILVGAVLVFAISYTLYRLLHSLLRRVLRRAKYVRRGLETLVLQAYRLLSLVSIGIIVLGQLGFDIKTILTGVGVAGIALSLAARDTLENILSGVSLLADASFGIGDYVIIQGTYGTVQEITLRCTRIRTPKNEILVVPNKLMANELVLNHSVGVPLRVELQFSIGYGENPDEARETVLALADDDERLREDQPPRVVVTSLGDSGVHMSFWMYPKEPFRERELVYDYSERILEALREANIEIPFPHIHLKMDQAST